MSPSFSRSSTSRGGGPVAAAAGAPSGSSSLMGPPEKSASSESRWTVTARSPRSYEPTTTAFHRPCDFSSTPCSDSPCCVRMARSRAPSALAYSVIPLLRSHDHVSLRSIYRQRRRLPAERPVRLCTDCRLATRCDVMAPGALGQAERAQCRSPDSAQKRTAVRRPSVITVLSDLLYVPACRWPGSPPDSVERDCSFNDPSREAGKE